MVANIPVYLFVFKQLREVKCDVADDVDDTLRDDSCVQLQLVWKT